MIAWLARPGRAWPVALALSALLSLLLWGQPATRWEWQPALAFTEPWRWWTAAGVHYSALHLGANLGAAAIVAVYGWAARTPLRGTVAWLLAWPLAHLALLAVPELARYGGLSGLMHAGVAVPSLGLVLWAHGRPRWIGAAVFCGMGIKLWQEAPWGPVLRLEPAWDIAIAPVAHFWGAAAGLVAVLAVHAGWRLSQRRQAAAGAGF